MFSMFAKFDGVEVGAALEQAKEQNRKTVKLHQEKSQVVGTAVMQLTSGDILRFKKSLAASVAWESIATNGAIGASGSWPSGPGKAESFLIRRQQEPKWSSDREGLDARDRTSLLESS